jgi:Stage II sporulation protein E (SpoIIE)
VAPSGARAASAGFIIAVAADAAAMAPGTHIGAAHPVGLGGEEANKVLAEKAASDVAAYARSLAQTRGRNDAFAEEAVLQSRPFTEREAVGAFVTLLLSRLDPRSKTLECASAGHPPGFLLNCTGDTEAVIDSTGLPLGLFSEAVFSTRTFLLEDGHTLVLCTDGASETSTAHDEEFGCDRILDHVRAHLHEGAREIAEGIYHAARTFAPESASATTSPPSS